MTSPRWSVRDAGISGHVLDPASVLACRLGSILPLRLAAAAVLVVLPRDGCENIEHQRVDRREHACRELARRGGLHPGCRQVESDHSDLPCVQFRSEPLPVGRGQTRQTVDLLDQEDVTGAAVGEKPEQFGTRELGAALVLDIEPDDRDVALRGEVEDLLLGTESVLLVGRGSEVDPRVHFGCRQVRLGWSHPNSSI